MKLILKITVILFAILLFNCNRNEAIEPNSEEAPKTSHYSLKRESSNLDAVEYYQNVANLMEYYSLHPDMYEQIKSNNLLNNEIYNPIVAKIEVLEIIDSAEVKRHLFDLSIRK